MSISIRHPLEGRPVSFGGGRLDEAAVALVGRKRAPKSSFPTVVAAWLRRVFGPSAPRRDRRSLFHSWAAADLAHRDPALQLQRLNKSR